MALIDKKLTELTEILSVPDNAFIHVVDPNDVSQSPQGSSYKAKKSTIGGAVKAQVTVSGTVKTNINNADPIVYLKGSVDALLSDKQDTLVDGVNIATINSQNLLNGGNIEIETNANLNVINESNANRTAVLSDANSFIAFTFENIAKTYTIPLNSIVDFTIGTQIKVRNPFSGTLTILGSNGVNFFAFDGLVAYSGSIISLIKIGVNSWNVNILASLGLSNLPSEINIRPAIVTTTILNAGRVLTTKIGVSGYPDNFEINAVDDGVRRWVSKNILRYETNLPILNSLDLTPKSYVDAKLNPTLNVLPKKGASGFLDSSISEDATKIVLTKDVKSATVFDDTPTTGATRFLVKAGASDGLSSPTFRVLNNSGTRSITIGLDANGFLFNFDNTHKIQGREITLSNNSLFGFSNSDVNGTRDIGFVRGSAGKLYIGNSEDGNFSGTLVTTKIGLGVIVPTESLDVLGSIKLSNLLKLGQFTTATEPAYVKGASFFNTTLNKMRIGGATAYETVTSS
jgi:hypothetical protein